MRQLAQWYNYCLYSAVIILLIIIISIVYRSYKNGITPMPSNYLMHQAVLNEIKRLAIQGQIVDAGSGWGNLLYKMAMEVPNCTYIGVENSIVPYIYAKIRYKFIQNRNHHTISFVKRDIYQYNYKSTELIVCYLYPEGMQKLMKTLVDQNISHIYVISICFAFNDLKPLQTTVCNDLYKTKVYTYEIKR